MDFLDPRKKRAHRIRLYIGYFLMAVAISIGTLILLLESFGYDLYRRRGEIIQNGLVFVENKPQSANIFVNDKTEGQTGKRLVLPEDTYKFRLEREGYRTWERTFRLRGNTVEQLTYPLLLPNELRAEDVHTYSSAPLLATQSPDRRWVLVLRPGSLTTFDLMDLNDRNNPVTDVTIPEEILNTAAGDHTFEPIEWSTDNRHALVKHAFSGGVEFLMIDREEPARSFNINQVFPVPVTQVTLRDRKFDQLHILDNEGTLWLGEAGSGRLTPLASQVRAFKSYGSDVLLYVSEEVDRDTPKNHVVAKVRDGDDTYSLRNLPTDRQLKLDIARYDGRWYMAVGTVEDQRVYVYRNPQDQVAEGSHLPAPVAVLRLQNNLTHVSFSSNARFIGAQSGSEFSVYDAEHDRQYRFDTTLNFPAEYKATWMDGFRYKVVSGDKVVVFDFDGSNRQALIPAYPGFLPFFDRNNEFLYTLAPSVDQDDRAAVTRASLLAPQDQ